jgi:hypothetical protein
MEDSRLSFALPHTDNIRLLQQRHTAGYEHAGRAGGDKGLGFALTSPILIIADLYRSGPTTGHEHAGHAGRMGDGG